MTTTTPASIGDLVRTRRRAAGITQEELAERAGLSPRSISEVERGGAHVPRRDTVALLARALNLAGSERASFEALIEHHRRGRVRGRRERASSGHSPYATVRVPERPNHNLPRSLTSFVGRERELAELTRLLPTRALLTLVGAGGIGKTRLARELAASQLDVYRDGVRLVELAGIADPAELPAAIAAAVGLERSSRADDVTAALVAHLEPEQLLLVLDNCEHLVEACAELGARLLRACPRLRILATSREPLSIAGEGVWPVPPLELAAAVRLFVERAQEASAVILGHELMPAVARICVAVDGIPLALELAAGRSRVLSVRELAERLDVDGGVLDGARWAGLPRHQTIRASLDWSYNQLDEPARTLLCRLAVFDDGWTLGLASTVCVGGPIEPIDVLELLAQLVDRSMVLVDARGSVARYRLLQPIRQYALDRLAASGEVATYQVRSTEAARMRAVSASSTLPSAVRTTP
jgi:predicted ATPase/DNA-binding XRE family transcriptional regulator